LVRGRVGFSHTSTKKSGEYNMGGAKGGGGVLPRRRVIQEKLDKNVTLLASGEKDRKTKRTDTF